MTQLRPYHSRIIGVSLLPQVEGQMRLVVIAIHFLRTYYVPRFQNEAPAIPFPAPTSPSYSIYQPLLSLKNQDPSAMPGIDLSPAHPTCPKFCSSFKAWLKGHLLGSLQSPPCTHAGIDRFLSVPPHQTVGSRMAGLGQIPFYLYKPSMNFSKSQFS